MYWLRRWTDLAVIECGFDGNVVDVGIGDGGHLCFLDGRNTTFWMKNKDRNIGFISQTVDSSAVENIVISTL